MTTAEETAIIRRVCLGEVAAFKDIIEAYKEMAYHAALGLTRNHDDALDLSQDALVATLKTIRTFDTNLPFFPWLYDIMKSHNNAHVRTRRI